MSCVGSFCVLERYEYKNKNHKAPKNFQLLDVEQVFAEATLNLFFIFFIHHMSFLQQDLANKGP